MGKYIPPPILDELKKVDLVTYFRTIMPYELVKASANEYTTKTHDSLRMSNGLWNWCSKGVGGRNAIDYLMKTEQLEFNDAANLLLKQLQNKVPTIEQQPTKPKEKHYHNAVFVGYDEFGNIKYAGCRSTNETIFKQDATGSDKSYSFRLESNTKTDTIYIFEGAIDALSYATFLKLYGMDYKAKTLISLAGIYQPASDISKSKIPLAIQRYLDKHPETKNIFLCFDNDKAGRKASKALQIVLADKYTVVIKPPKKRQRL